jgi:hypothetical protein
MLYLISSRVQRLAPDDALNNCLSRGIPALSAYYASDCWPCGYERTWKMRRTRVYTAARSQVCSGAICSPKRCRQPPAQTLRFGRDSCLRCYARKACLSPAPGAQHSPKIHAHINTTTSSFIDGGGGTSIHRARCHLQLTAGQSKQRLRILSAPGKPEQRYRGGYNYGRLYDLLAVGGITWEVTEETIVVQCAGLLLPRTNRRSCLTERNNQSTHCLLYEPLQTTFVSLPALCLP